MTDKQIIINRVDVAECEYLGLYKECKLKCGSCCPVDCSDNPNCHYKLYKRKEQECEEKQKTAQDAINKLCAEKSALHNELDQLKAENIKFTLDTKNLVAQYSAKLKRLKKTLAEIKEIAENMNNECFYSDFDCKYCDMKNGCTYFNKSKILQIIKEMK